MTNEDLVKLVAKKACDHLEYDDAHPDVGLGMSVYYAIKLAEDDIRVEAARWNSFAALKLEFDDETKTKAIELIRKKRRVQYVKHSAVRVFARGHMVTAL